MARSTPIRPKKSFLLVTVSIIVPILVIFVFLYQIGVWSFSREYKMSASENISPSGISLAEAASPIETKPIYEVQIANNGVVLLKNARVISILGDDLRVGMDWEFASLSWRVQTTPSVAGTQFTKLNREKGVFSDIRVGDSITVTGKIIESGVEPIIDAQFVRL